MSAKVTIPYSDPNGPAGEATWAADLLAVLGAPASSLADPRIAFLAAQEQEEGNQPGTATYKREHNPLSTSLAEPGSTSINSSGVQAYPSFAEGLEATASTLRQPSDASYLKALTTPGETLAGLEKGLAASSWAGTAPGATGGYAATVASIAADYAPPSDTSAQGGVGTGWGPATGPAGWLPSIGLGGIGGSILKYVLEGVAAIAGVALIGVGIAKASGGDKDGGSGGVAKLAAGLAA